jgi:hypothetical protein
MDRHSRRGLFLPNEPEGSETKAEDASMERNASILAHTRRTKGKSIQSEDSPSHAVPHVPSVRVSFLDWMASFRSARRSGAASAGWRLLRLFFFDFGFETGGGLYRIVCTLTNPSASGSETAREGIDVEDHGFRIPTLRSTTTTSNIYLPPPCACSPRPPRLYSPRHQLIYPSRA